MMFLVFLYKENVGDINSIVEMFYLYWNILEDTHRISRYHQQKTNRKKYIGTFSIQCSSPLKSIENNNFSIFLVRKISQFVQSSFIYC